ncbi:hypothetical protein [Amycolatopsis azurea]|uniref:Uncharacterized protein n=1 Tax=Amycolatopsis azurea DSM 43854 TaxID=1238180 RepID=M2NJ79_9PSEU|nr:hypothetical protein [Amycolatopsis azurea]EMD22199.1 hypothetical protein C791_0351 [Amycolatopsis azurea DSM 43854]OOC01155.1 hypothetical protein B0293_39155 [Amycolatopsis azurea DSM 43854]
MSGDTIIEGVENENVASGNAKVGQQIGVQNVESVFHDATIYTVSDEDTAERKHEVALAYLTGGLPRRAEDLFYELVINGHQSTERIYYYVLAVLSERGFRDLTAELAGKIRDVGKLCASFPEDEWSRAHRVVRSLVDLVRSDAGVESFTTVAAFGELSADRQDEISRHLSLLVTGVLDQRLDAERKHKVSTERLSRNREDRAWKFFEPKPAMPTRYRVRTSAADSDRRRPLLIGGTVTMLSFAGLFFGPLNLPFWAGLLLLIAGSAVTIRYGVEYTGHVLHLASRRDAARPADEPSEPSQVDKLIDRCFRDACPPDVEDWTWYGAGHRWYLRRRFNDWLRHDQNYSQSVKRLKWLFDWHARRAARQWQGLDSRLEPEPAAPSGARNRQVAGVLVIVAGLGLLGLALRWQIVPIAVGSWSALPAVIELFAVRKATRLLSADAEVLFEQEMAEYERWRDELSDRPDDIDMARWLALDKAYIKAEALRRGDIAERDLVSHVVLNQQAPGARRGVVPHGPPRYEAYLVTVILLTRHGVRESRVHLNFTTGEVKNEAWNVFGYDRIASASLKVKEKRVKNPGELERKVRNRHFRLRLLNGVEIFAISDRPDGESDTEVDDEVELKELAAATSGMDAALPILEAVAHKGRDWIEFENDRRTMWSRNWSD